MFPLLRSSGLLRLAVLFSSVSSILLLLPLPASARETTAPDILLLIADDMGVQLGCYGDKQADTPNMDKLAAQGIRFDNAWVTQAGCSPSRGSIMTGLYPHQNGLVGLAHTGFTMNRQYSTIPSLLKDAGYYTGVVGKVHIAPDLPFDYEIQQGDKRLEPRNPKSYARHVHDFLTKAGERPVFLNVSFVDPHRPFARQVKDQPADPITGNEVAPLPFVGDLGFSEAVRSDTADYYNGVKRVDMGVGLVLDELRKAGRLQNTVILLVGDHGAPFTRSKTTCYHAGLNVPFIVNWPGISKPGSSSKALISTVDILPTLLDAAGAKAADVTGVSLRESVTHPGTSPRDFLVAEHTAHLPLDYYPRRTIRDDRYQLIHNLLHNEKNPEEGTAFDSAWEAVMVRNEGTSATRELMERFAQPPEYELYDLQNDPGSFRNLASNPEMQNVKKRLTAELKKWQEKTGDDMTNPEAVRAYRTHILEVVHPRAMRAKVYRKIMEDEKEQAKLKKFQQRIRKSQDLQ